MHFFPSLLILLLGIFVLKPIPVLLKSDKNIQESSSKMRERAKLSFVVSKRSDVSLRNSTDLTLNVNNKTITMPNLHNTTQTRPDIPPKQKASNMTGHGNNSSGIASENNLSNKTLSDKLSNKTLSDKLSNETSIPGSANSFNASLQSPNANGTSLTPVNNKEIESIQNKTISVVTKTLYSALTTVLKIETHVSVSTTTSISTSISTSILTTTITNTATNTVTNLLTKTVDKSYNTTTLAETSSSASATSTAVETDSMDIHHYEMETTKNKSLFGEGSLIAILIPSAVFIIVFIALIWFWCRRRRRFSKVPPKQVGNYKITPIINDISEGVQRTNYSEKDQSYSVGETDFNKGGYRGWGATGTPTNNKSPFSRNQSLSSTNVSPAYQKPDYYFSGDNAEKDSKLAASKYEVQNSKSLESRNLHAQIFNTSKNSNYSTSPYSLNSQNTMDSFNRNAALLDYDSNVAKENFSNKLYSYSDIPRSLSTNYGRFSENRRNGFLRQNPSTFHKYSEKSEMHDFSKGS
ncbi:hypothetical protein PNEG_02461 [Pneumocystis murina B123]|uniref:Mid2 domain-containing protein n=1 Tax=Pneumocystis murina (strain B123) TaxID=1069680 RepID=M7NKF5_PNEMU|nr:hypothetical protein PNEG_02461 [Pneumocystis murina B123]EMR09118.1 hypothetical protein PNEG_02461 [Pneumocystis murina B123]